MMTDLLIRYRALAFTALFAFGITGTAVAADRCEPVMRDMLKKLGVAPTDIRSFEFFTESGSDGSGPVHVGWVRLNSCKGHLVVQTTESCFPIQSYTTGDCSVKGAAKY